MPEGMSRQLVVIVLLILANGVLAMSEIAIVSARRARLQARADAGDAGARCALELARQPNRFLSTVQIGISLVGILAGAYGGVTLADELAAWLARAAPPLAAWSDEAALGAVVAGITYLSLVVGELVPKRIGLTHPERVASLVSRPMRTVSFLAAPLVFVLSGSTEILLRLLRVGKSKEPPVTEEEVEVMLDVGTEAGVFHETERDLVARIFWLADQRVESFLTPRHRIRWIEVSDPPERWREVLIAHRYARYPVCEGSIDKVLGVVHGADVLAAVLAGEEPDLRALLRQPHYVPASMHALRLLDLFRDSGVHLAIVVDEFGGTEGLVTLNDVLEEISGDLGRAGEPEAVRRSDGSWLVDAAMAMSTVRELLGIEEDEDPYRSHYRTLGGFLLHRIGGVPTTGASVDELGHRFEIVDMDGNRIDKVLIVPGREAVPGA